MEKKRESIVGDMLWRVVFLSVALLTPTAPISAAPGNGIAGPANGSELRGESELRQFNLPAADARRSLRRFSRQSGYDVVFATQTADGIITREVRGVYTAGEAMERLLDATGLVAERNASSGAFAVTRDPSSTASSSSSTGDSDAMRRPAVSGGANPTDSNPTKSEMHQKRPPINKALTSGIIVVLGFVNSALAQNPEPSDEIVELSPFEVSPESDVGYIATSTLAGSRLNTELINTPAAISVMTGEFLEDIAANDVTEAIDYGLNATNDIGGGGANVGASTGNGIQDNAYNFQIRGYRSVVSTRDYFTSNLAADSFNIERIEFARGPNSLIFGIGGPGGIVNADFKNANTYQQGGSIQMRFASWNQFRFAVDVNQPVVEDKLGVRVNLLHQKSDGWKDFAKNDQDRGAVALTYNVTKSTKVRLGFELGSLEQNRVRPWAPVDQFGFWEDQGSYTIAFGTPESPAVLGDDNYAQTRSGGALGNQNNGLDPDIPPGQTFERRTAHLGNPTILLMDGPLEGQWIRVGQRNEGRRYYRTSYSNNLPGYNTPAFVYDESIIPRTANPLGPGHTNFNDYRILRASIDQRLGKNINLNLTVQQTETDETRQRVSGFSGIGLKYDVTTLLPTFNADGTYNATHGGPDTTGQGVGALNFNNMVENPYLLSPIISVSPSYNDRVQTQDDIRFSANWNLNTEGLGRHQLLGFLQRSKTELDSQNYAETNVSPNRPRTNTWFNGENYGGLDYHVDYFSDNLADRGVPDIFSNYQPVESILYGTDVYDGEQYEMVTGFIRNNWNGFEEETDSAAFAVVSKWFGGSLVTTAGIRKDQWERINYSRERDSLQEAIGKSAGDAQTEEGDTYSVGFVYHLPFVRGLSIFANKSTNFQSQGGAQYAEDEDLRPNLEIGALKGDGKDYGVKFNLFQNKLYATVAYYENNLANDSTGFDGNVRSYINAIWTTILNDGPNTVMTDAENPNGHHFGGSDTRDQVSSGWEFELIANPSDSWRLSFNVSKSENVVSNLGNAITAYVNKHRSEWETWRGTSYDTGNSPGFLGDNTVGDLIDGLDRLIAFVKAGEGVSETNIRPWQANLFTSYTFREGGAKGLSLGGGINYRGDQILGTKAATVDNPVSEQFTGGAYTLFNALVAYEFEFNEKFDIKFQMNIDNVFDNDDPQVLASYYNPDVDDIEEFFYYLEPRKFTFTTTIKF